MQVIKGWNKRFFCSNKNKKNKKSLLNKHLVFIIEITSYYNFSVIYLDNVLQQTQQNKFIIRRKVSSIKKSNWNRKKTEIKIKSVWFFEN